MENIIADELKLRLNFMWTNNKKKKKNKKSKKLVDM